MTGLMQILALTAGCLFGLVSISVLSAKETTPDDIRDPLLAGADENAKPLDLNALIELALRHNPEFGASEADLAAIGAQRDRAAAGHLPDLRVQAGWTEYRRQQRLYPAASPGEPALTTHHMIGADLVLSVPIYSGGRVTRSVEAFRHEEDAAQDRGRWIRADIRFRVTAAYYRILAQRQLIAALNDTEGALLQNLDHLSALVAEAKATPFDRLRMEVRLSAVRQRRVQEEAILRKQTVTIVTLVGHSASTDRIIVTGQLTVPEAGRSKPAAQMVQDALTRRSDLNALRSRVEAQARRIGVARAGYSPELVLQGIYGVRAGLWPRERPDGVSAVADVGQLGLYVDIPVFQGGRVSAEVREQRARLIALQEMLRQAELGVRLDIESAALDYGAAMERVSLSGEMIGQAKEAFRVEMEKYTVGRSSILDVLSVQTDLLEAESLRAQALADAHIAVAALDRALGEDL